MRERIKSAIPAVTNWFQLRLGLQKIKMKIFVLLIFLIFRVYGENFTENRENFRRFPRAISCGSVASASGFIVNGETVQKGDYPW